MQQTTYCKIIYLFIFVSLSSLSHELSFPPTFLQLLMHSRALQAKVLLHCHDGSFHEAEQLMPYLFCFFFFCSVLALCK